MSAEVIRRPSGAYDVRYSLAPRTVGTYHALTEADAESFAADVERQRAHWRHAVERWRSRLDRQPIR